MQTSDVIRSGIWHAASMWASNRLGPSGSPGATMTARDGCSEASAATVAIGPLLGLGGGCHDDERQHGGPGADPEVAAAAPPRDDSSGSP